MDIYVKKLWPYSYNDKSTWKYKEIIIYKTSVPNEIKYKWILNKDFKYKHLDINKKG